MVERRDAEQARALFLRLNKPVFYFFANRGFPPEECRELVQETFVRLLGASTGLHEVANPDSWVLGIAKNVWLEELRRRRRERSRGLEVPFDASSPDEEISRVADDGPDVLGILIDDEHLRLLHRNLDQLPSKMRACAKMRARGCSYRQIAAILGTSIGTVKSQIFDAKKILRKAILEDFDRPSAKVG